MRIEEMHCVSKRVAEQEEELVDIEGPFLAEQDRLESEATVQNMDLEFDDPNVPGTSNQVRSVKMFTAVVNQDAENPPTDEVCEAIKELENSAAQVAPLSSSIPLPPNKTPAVLAFILQSPFDNNAKPAQTLSASQEPVLETIARKVVKNDIVEQETIPPVAQTERATPAQAPLISLPHQTTSAVESSDQNVFVCKVKTVKVLSTTSQKLIEKRATGNHNKIDLVERHTILPADLTVEDITSQQSLETPSLYDKEVESTMADAIPGTEAAVKSIVQKQSVSLPPPLCLSKITEIQSRNRKRKISSINDLKVSKRKKFDDIFDIDAVVEEISSTSGALVAVKPQRPVERVDRWPLKIALLANTICLQINFQALCQKKERTGLTQKMILPASSTLRLRSQLSNSHSILSAFADRCAYFLRSLVLRSVKISITFAKMPEFALQTEPSQQVCFTSEKLGEEPVNTVVKITNPTTKTVAWKVKCTSNEMFRIRPPVGMLGPQKNEDVKVIFNAGKTVPEDSKHYFVVYYISAKDDVSAKKPPRELWAENANTSPEGSRRLYVTFKKNGSKDAKKDEAKKDDVKKDEDKKEDKEEDKKAAEDDKKGSSKEKKDEGRTKRIRSLLITRKTIRRRRMPRKTLTNPLTKRRTAMLTTRKMMIRRR
uniref:MSP domain-containing protein n=1 Tax=Ditylenchus dipsaci TaxID=166011 RepID=A0A915DYT4_9BILA